MKYSTTLPAGELICAGVKSQGPDVVLDLTPEQAEQALRKGYVIELTLQRRENLVPETVERVAAKKK